MPPSVSLPPSLRPTRAELAVGVMFGPDPAAPPLPPATHPSIRAALEAVLLEALQQSPCVVAFSGGRDSSVILAIAMHVARREGLPEPVVATDRYPHVPASLEDDWQDRVAAHLGVDAWSRIDRGDDHEVLGSRARSAMRTHGVLLPGTWAAMGMPPEAGSGGVLVTGYGGDELFSPPARPGLSALAARRRPSLRRPHHLAGEVLPRRLRARVAERSATSWDLPWVRPEVQRETARAEARDATSAPVRYDRLLPLLWADRDVRSGSATGTLMAAETGATCVDPFCDPRVLAAVARHYGPAFPQTRSGALADIAGDLLPEDVLRRRSKADFTHVFYGETSRDWVAAWTGTGADERSVDPEALRRELLGPEPDARAVPSVQVAWLAQDRAGAA